MGINLVGKLKLDNKERYQDLKRRESIKLDIGCGPYKKFGFVGVDMCAYEGVDLVGDVFDVLSILESGVVDEIHSAHFVEHLSDPAKFFKEIIRVMKPGAIATIVAPHFSNPYYYSDMTHKTHFGLYSLSYFAECSLFKRRVPVYEEIPNLDLRKVDLVFRSSRPFYSRHLFKKVFQLVFNASSWTKEFYEENLSWIIPAYEVKYVFAKK